MEMISPIQKIEMADLVNRGLEVYIKRDDLIGGAQQGNKFRKLKYHLLKAKELDKQQLLTFGGAFSNHLYATAAVGQQLKWPTIGFIRGEIDPLNPTLLQLKRWNMQLIALSRETYKQRQHPAFLQKLKGSHPMAYIIPEGGSHPLAIKGVRELVQEVYEQTTIKFDYWVCPVGTGSTAAGILQRLKKGEKLIASSVLKGFDALQAVAQQSFGSAVELDKIISLNASYRGFAKPYKPVEEFIKSFYQSQGILLDPIYLGKVVYHLFQLIKRKYFPASAKILIIHTGGLQGIKGYNYLHGTNLPEPKFDHLDP